jgi:hypothetical protein
MAWNAQGNASVKGRFGVRRDAISRVKWLQLWLSILIRAFPSGVVFSLQMRRAVQHQIRYGDRGLSIEQYKGSRSRP